MENIIYNIILVNNLLIHIKIHNSKKYIAQAQLNAHKHFKCHYKNK